MLTASGLRALATQAPQGPACDSCAALKCPGWESLPAGFSSAALLTLGTLRSEETEPSWAEHHPQGTRLESPAAPIALGWYPYNRADVCACRGCGRLFLRYAEGGGYFFDERVRELNTALLAEPPPPP